MVKRKEMRLTRGGRLSCNGGGGATIMMGFKERAFAPLVAVSLEELVPQNHFYRHLQKVLDLSFVYDLVRESYSVAGRPSIDPVVFFKLQLVMFARRYPLRTLTHASGRRSTQRAVVRG